MKTGLTQKQLLRLSRKAGLSFNPNMTKQHMLIWVEAGKKSVCKQTCIYSEIFAKLVIEADKQYQREKKLKELGIS